MMTDTMARIRADFLEMPGLRVTTKQAARLCGVDGSMCQDVLDALVERRFLCANADGTYVRLREENKRWP